MNIKQSHQQKKIAKQLMSVAPNQKLINKKKLEQATNQTDWVAGIL